MLAIPVGCERIRSGWNALHVPLASVATALICPAACVGAIVIAPAVEIAVAVSSAVGSGSSVHVTPATSDAAVSGPQDGTWAGSEEIVTLAGHTGGGGAAGVGGCRCSAGRASADTVEAPAASASASCSRALPAGSTAELAAPGLPPTLLDHVGDSCASRRLPAGVPGA